MVPVRELKLQYRNYGSSKRGIRVMALALELRLK